MSKDFWEDMDDYYAFTSCCSDSDGTSTSGGGSGCGSGCLPWVLAFLFVLYLFGKLI